MTTRPQTHWTGDRTQMMQRNVEARGTFYRLRARRTARGTWLWTVTAYDTAARYQAIDWAAAETRCLGDAMATAEFKITLG